MAAASAALRLPQNHLFWSFFQLGCLILWDEIKTLDYSYGINWPMFCQGSNKWSQHNVAKLCGLQKLVSWDCWLLCCYAFVLKCGQRAPSPGCLCSRNGCQVVFHLRWGESFEASLVADPNFNVLLCHLTFKTLLGDTHTDTYPEIFKWLVIKRGETLTVKIDSNLFGILKQKIYLQCQDCSVDSIFQFQVIVIPREPKHRVYLTSV